MEATWLLKDQKKPLLSVVTLSNFRPLWPFEKAMTKSRISSLNQFVVDIEMKDYRERVLHFPEVCRS